LLVTIAGAEDHTETANDDKEKKNDASNDIDISDDRGKEVEETFGFIGRAPDKRGTGGVNSKFVSDIESKLGHIKNRIAKNGRICDMEKRGLVKKLTSRGYRKRLVRLVEQKVGRPEDVEEIVQESLIAAWDSLPTYKAKSDLFTWLGAIARHEIADFYRRRKLKQIVFSRLPFLKNLVSEALGPELAYQELETKRKILRTLKGLSEGYSQVLRLKYIEGLSRNQNLGGGERVGWEFCWQLKRAICF